MSAFLAFANKRRGIVKHDNPDMNNAEISKLLSDMWKEAPQHVRQKYIDHELAKRNEYKAAMIDWRKKKDEEKRCKRQLQHQEALQESEEAEKQALNAGNEEDFDLSQQSNVASAPSASQLSNDGTIYLPLLQSMQASRAGVLGDSGGANIIASLMRDPFLPTMGYQISHLVDQRYQTPVQSLQTLYHQMLNNPRNRKSTTTTISRSVCLGISCGAIQHNSFWATVTFAETIGIFSICFTAQS
jgi:hypothetical protein